MKLRLTSQRLSALLTFAIIFSSTLAAQAQTEADVKAHYTKLEQMITMRDGVRLFTSIHLPKDKSHSYPIMLHRTPYGVGPYGADKYKASLGPSESFEREGYIFVYQDVRGRYMSEGQFEDVRPYIRNKTGKQIDETTRHL